MLVIIADGKARKLALGDGVPKSSTLANTVASQLSKDILSPMWLIGGKSHCVGSLPLSTY